MTSTGAFDNKGIPQGSFTRMDDLVDVESTAAKDGDVLIYKAGFWVLNPAAAAGIQDHSKLFGLDADDHPQYLTKARGDARYDATGEAVFQAGARLRWKGAWPQPAPFAANDVVRDGTWLMVANKKTWDRPGPSMDGENRWRIDPNALFTYEPGRSRELIYGQRYYLGASRALFLQAARVWVPAVDLSVRYQAWLVTNPLDADTMVWTELGSPFRATEAKWVEVPVPNILLPAGATFDVVVAVVSDVGRTETFADYTYVRVPDSSVAAATGSVTHPQDDSELLLISRQDQDLVDRSAMLRTLSAGSLIEADGETWVVRAVGEEASHFRFTVAPSTAANGGVHTFKFTAYAAADFVWGKKAGHWSSANTGSMLVRGLYSETGYSTAAPVMDAFSVDIRYQEAIMSPDWDMLSATGGSGGGASGDHTHDDRYINVDGDYMEGPLHVEFALTDDEAAQLGQVKSRITAHEAAANPHPNYLSPAEGDLLYEAFGAVAGHVGAADPHATYLNTARGDLRYLKLTGGTLTGLLNVVEGTSDANAVSYRQLLDFGRAYAGFEEPGSTLDWDIATVPESGVYPRLMHSSQPHAPESWRSTYFYLLNVGLYRGQGNPITQVAYPYTVSTAARIWVRSRYQGVWSAWQSIGAADLDSHLSALDPHPQYLNLTRGDARYESFGAVSAHVGAAHPHDQYVLTAGDTMTGHLVLPASAPSSTQAARTDWVKQWDKDHTDAADPHPQYLTQAEGETIFDLKGSGTGAVGAHEAAADPHPGYQREIEKGVAGGYASLDGAGHVPTSQLPPLAINDTFVVANQVEMLALTAQRGDMAIRMDSGRTYVLAAEGASTLGNWKEVLAAGQVTSVNGLTGAVTLTANNISSAATGDVAATTVQGAIAELASEKQTAAQVATAASGAITTHVGLADPHTQYALRNRNLVAGAGLTGGGDLSQERYFDVGAGEGITVDPDAVRINRSTVDQWYADKTTTANALLGVTQQVDALMGDLTYCGTYNALTYKINTISAFGSVHPQYVIGQNLPDAAIWNAKHYFLVVVGGPTSPTDGIYEPPDTVAHSYQLGDWVLSNGAGQQINPLNRSMETIAPMINLPEAADKWIHLSYSSRQLLATSIVMTPSLSGAAGETAQQVLTTLWNNTADKLRQIVAGAGLTGGGDLQADRTINVGAGTGISVSADAVAVDRLTTDLWYEAKGAVAAHVALADPHPNKYLSLSGGTLTGDLYITRPDAVGMHLSMTGSGVRLDHKNRETTNESARNFFYGPDDIRRWKESFTASSYAIQRFNSAGVYQGTALVIQDDLRLELIGDPTATNHAATKLYVDNTATTAGANAVTAHEAKTTNIHPQYLLGTDAVKDYATKLYASNFAAGEMLSNGFGFQGALNWPVDAVMRQDELYAGQASFLTPMGYRTWFHDEFIAVDPAKKYHQSAYFKESGSYVGGSAYLVIACMDIDRMSIYPQMYSGYFRPASKTKLTRELKPGDTTIKVESTAGFRVDNVNRTLCFGPYTNSKGYTYPDMTYTRYHAGYNCNQFTIIDATTLGLPAPFVNGYDDARVHPVGTDIWESGYGGTYIYPDTGAIITNTAWTRFAGYFGGGTYNPLRDGTAFIQPGYLVNAYSGSTARQFVSAASIREVVGAELLTPEADARYLKLTGGTVSGTLTAAGALIANAEATFNSTVWLPANGANVYIGSAAGDRLRLHRSGANSYVDYASGSLLFRQDGGEAALILTANAEAQFSRSPVIPDGIGSNRAASVGQVQAAVDTKVAKVGDTMSGQLMIVAPGPLLSLNGTVGGATPYIYLHEPQRAHFALGLNDTGLSVRNWDNTGRANIEVADASQPFHAITKGQSDGRYVPIQGPQTLYSTQLALFGPVNESAQIIVSSQQNASVTVTAAAGHDASHIAAHSDWGWDYDLIAFADHTVAWRIWAQSYASARYIIHAKQSGLATVYGDPTEDLGIATKRYVDTKVGNIDPTTFTEVHIGDTTPNPRGGKVLWVNTAGAGGDPEVDTYVTHPIFNAAQAAQDAKIDSNTAVAAAAIARAGDTLAGPLIAARNPVGDLEVATKQYVDVKTASGSGYVAGGSAPIGTIVAFGSGVAPTGWHLCDGTAHGSAALQALTGSPFAPDLRGKFVLGASSTYPEKSTGGAATHTLTINEMPSHSHAWASAGVINPQGVPVNNDDMVGGDTNAGPVGPASPEAANNAIKTRGGDAAHNNMPPYYSMVYIIKKTDEVADDHKARFVAKAGDSMTGALTLSGAPTAANHAATKTYVDGKIRGGVFALPAVGSMEAYSTYVKRITHNFGVTPLVLTATLVSAYAQDNYPDYIYYPDASSSDLDTVSLQLGFSGPNHFNVHIHATGRAVNVNVIQQISWIAIMP